MIYSISNEFIKASIKLTGAELCSLIDIESNTELMWEGNPQYWKGQAPILFPIIGALKEGTYYYKGEKYTLPNHGLVRKNTSIKLLTHTQNAISFSYRYDQKTLKQYPFKFELIINYSLNGKALVVNHKVKNAGTDEMLFSIGAHPAFKCPLSKDEKYSDYTLKFETTENLDRWLLENNGLIGNPAKYMNNTNILKLYDEIFDEGALVFKNIKSTFIKLVNKQNKDILIVSFNGFNYMGIWSKERAPFVCIEPWLGIADSVHTNQQFEEKEGLLKLDPKDTFEASYSIEVLL
jgi:galactose mutarotase-like enzyme